METYNIYMWIAQLIRIFSDGLTQAAKFSHHYRKAGALTLDKVTPTVVVEVFTIWITEIIPLLFDNMLPESGLTSTVTWLCDQDVCRLCVCLSVDALLWAFVCMLLSTQRWWFCLFTVYELLPKLRHGDVIFVCDLINRQNYRSLPKGQYCCVVMEMHCHMSNAFSQSNPHWFVGPLW